MDGCQGRGRMNGGRGSRLGLRNETDSLPAGGCWRRAAAGQMGWASCRHHRCHCELPERKLPFTGLSSSGGGSRQRPGIGRRRAVQQLQHEPNACMVTDPQTGLRCTAPTPPANRSCPVRLCANIPVSYTTRWFRPGHYLVSPWADSWAHGSTAGSGG